MAANDNFTAEKKATCQRREKAKAGIEFESLQQKEPMIGWGGEFFENIKTSGVPASCGNIPANLAHIASKSTSLRTDGRK